MTSSSVADLGDCLDPVLVVIDVGIHSIAVLLSTVIAPGYSAH